MNYIFFNNYDIYFYLIHIAHFNYNEIYKVYTYLNKFYEHQKWVDKKIYIQKYFSARNYLSFCCFKKIYFLLIFSRSSFILLIIGQLFFRYKRKHNREKLDSLFIYNINQSSNIIHNIIFIFYIEYKTVVRIN
jgi:hypothetical protein